MIKPFRVCIVSEHASVKFGGEASLPYHYFRVLRSRGVDAWLITHERTRAELEALFPRDLDRLRFVPDMTLQKIFYRISLLLPRRLSESTFGLANQFLTQWAQRSILRELITETTVVHQPIPVSPRFPSLIYGVGAPVIIGPMNGGMDYPPAFRTNESWFIRTFVSLGRSVSGIANHLLPGKRDAAMLLVANERTRQSLPLQPKGQVIELVENGVDLKRWSALDNVKPFSCAASKRFLFMGRLVDWKALDIVLEAMKSIPDAHLDVVGDGNMSSQWRSVATQFGIADRVRFHGWKSQIECSVILRDSIALVLPSLYECGGAVVLEAMALGKPVIATAWGGPKDYLDTTCGILVEPISRSALVTGFADGMLRLMQSPELCQTMGQQGSEKIRTQFDWEKKADRILELYDEVLKTN